MISTRYSRGFTILGMSFPKSYLGVGNTALNFETINDTPLEGVEFYGSNSCKIACDRYMNDRDVMMEYIK